MAQTALQDKKLRDLVRKTVVEVVQEMSMKLKDYGIDRDLGEALREFKEGKTIGPFNNAKDLMESLRSRNNRK